MADDIRKLRNDKMRILQGYKILETQVNEV